MYTLPRQVSVAIIGAGPVGLMTANLLGKFGIKTALIERNSAPYEVPRAITLDDEGCRTLQATGLDREYLPKTRQGLGSRYYDDDNIPFANIGPGPIEYGFPRRTQIFQPEFESALLDGLKRFENIFVSYSTEMQDFVQNKHEVIISLLDTDNKIRYLEAKFLLGADGARSSVRQKLNIKMLGNSYPEDWLIVDTLNDPDQESVSKFFCRRDRPYVSIPAPNGGRRYEFRARAGENQESLLAPNNIQKLIAPIRPFNETDILRAVVYTFEAKIAEHWRKGRVFLLGDAAHLTPPFAGQGMNAGLRDAHNLAWKLWAVNKGKAGYLLLDTYEQERRDPSWAMIQLAVAMGDIVMPQGEEDVAFRSSVLKWMERFPVARDFIISMKFKPPPRYQNGAFVAIDSQPFTGSLVGQMLPQPALTPKYHANTKLDDIIGIGFAFISQEERTTKEMIELKTKLLPEISPKLISIGAPDQRDDKNITLVVPEECSALTMLRAHRDQILLVRPDRYVAAAFWAKDAKDTMESFRLKAKMNRES